MKVQYNKLLDVVVLCRTNSDSDVEEAQYFLAGSGLSSANPATPISSLPAHT